MSPSFSSSKGLRASLGLIGFVVIVGFVTVIRQNETNSALPPPAPIDRLDEGSFTFTQSFMVQGAPEAVYDALTGDITGWWDHSLSGHPSRMFIEPRPGGGFYEMVGNSGDGIIHARVTYAVRGERLTLDGPLPFTGHPIRMLTTYELDPVGDSTEVTLVVRAAGEIQPRWPARIERTWRHFIYERFIPYWNSHREQFPKTTRPPVSEAYEKGPKSPS